MHLMDEARQHMAIFNVEVVMRSKDIGRDDSSEGAAMLLEVGPAETGSPDLITRMGPQCPQFPLKLYK